MNTKIYRNIYFWESLIKSGNGNLDVYYYGHIFSNAKFIKNFYDSFDENLDLKIICNSCAAKRYRSFIKVKKK